MASETIGTARIDVEVNLDKLEASASAAKRAVADMATDAQTQYNKINASEKRRIDSLIKQADTLGLTRAEQIAYNAGLKTSGPLLDEINRRLATNAQRAGAATIATNQYGLSQKQTAFAMRGVPAQITDIITSLQGGQRPLNVLLQQGGQLKDMFGGIAPAARALAAGLTSLINPLTIGAAAIATFVIAFTQAEEQANAFDRALITTGNFANLTAEELDGLAQKLDGLAGTTSREAASALAEVAATGRFTGEQIELVARAALQMQNVAGKAIKDTVAEFVELGKDPVTAILKLNETQHFLTQAQLDNIQTLKEQGRETDAATAAFRAYADEIDQRAPALAGHVGFISETFRTLKNVGAEAWDGFVSGIKRADEELLSRSNSIRKSISAVLSATPFGAFLPGGQMGIDALLQAGSGGGKKPAASSRGGSRQTAVDSAAAAKAIKERQDAEKEFAQLEQSNLSKKEKLTAEIVKIRETGLKAGRSELEIEKQIGQARQRYAESLPKPKKAPKGPVDETIAIIARIKQQIALNEEQAKSEDTLTTSERLRVQVLQEIERIGTKVSAARRAEIESLLATAIATDDVVQKAKEEAKLKQELTRLTNQLEVAEANRRQANEADLMTIGRGAKAVETLQRELEINQEYEDGLRELRDKGIAETDASYIKQEELLRASRARSLEIEKSYQEQRAELEADWTQGANRALEDYLDQARNVAGQTYDFFSNTFNGLADATAAYATGTKDAFGSLMDDIYKQALKFLAQQAIKKLLEAFGGGGGSTGGTTGNVIDLFTSGFASGGYTGDGAVNQPAGIVHAGEYVVNASATRALGRSVLDQINTGQMPTGGVGVTINMTNNFDRNNSTATPEQIAYKTAIAANRELNRT
jgi:lambda family phage tail tape measure protein